MRYAAFLDRDGVLNEDLGYVCSIDRFRWLPGAIEAVGLLKRRGYLVFVVTNQSGIARGFFGEDAVEALHAHMQADLAAANTRIDAFRYCPHHPQAILPGYRASCTCRKPAPGLVLELIYQFDVDRGGSFLIGDKPSDMAAAAAAGIAGVLFEGGSLHKTVEGVLATAGTRHEL